MIIATYHADSRGEMPPPIGPHNTDGLLVFSDGLFDEDLIHLNSIGFPMVLEHRTPPVSLAIPSVTVENVEITQHLIEHLIKVHGKRRILFLRGPIHQEDSGAARSGVQSSLASKWDSF